MKYAKISACLMVLFVVSVRCDDNTDILQRLTRQAACTRPIVNKETPCRSCNSDFTCSNGGTCCPKTLTIIKRKPKGLTCNDSDRRCTRYNPTNLAQQNRNKKCICGTTKFCCTSGPGAATTRGSTSSPVTSQVTVTVSAITATTSTTVTPSTSPESTTQSTSANTTTQAVSTSTATSTTSATTTATTTRAG